MKKNIIALCLTALFVFPVSAGDSFDQLIDRIVSTNPDVMVAVSRSNSEIEALRAENILEGPEIEAFHKWGNLGGRKYGAGISQGFDWPGLYRSRRNAAVLTAGANDCLNNAVILEKKLEAKSLLIDLVSAKRTLNLLTSIQTSMKTLASKYDEGYRKGEVSILDKNKIDIEVLKISSQVTKQITACEEIITSIVNLAGGTDVSPSLDSLDNYPEEMLLSVSDYENRIIDNDPMLTYYRIMELVGDENVRISRLSGFPSFSVGYEWEREEGQNFNGVSLGIRFSSWSGKHRKDSARYAAIENQTRLQAERKRMIADMVTDRSAALTFATQIDGYSRILDKGNQEALLKQALDGGEISLLTYLQEVNYFVEARIDYEEICHDYNIVLARLNKINMIH